MQKLLTRMRETPKFDNNIEEEDSWFQIMSQFIDEKTNRLEERVQPDLKLTIAKGADSHEGKGDGGAALETLLTEMSMVKSLLTYRAEHVFMRHEFVQMSSLNRCDSRR